MYCLSLCCCCKHILPNRIAICFFGSCAEYVDRNHGRDSYEYCYQYNE